jgi:hypothetical protein
MNRIIPLTLVLAVTSCNNIQLNEVSKIASQAGSICTGTTILGVAGTATCSAGAAPVDKEEGPLALSSFAARKDSATFPVSAGDFATFFSAPARTVASLQDEVEGNDIFSANHSVIPSPLADSDGINQPYLAVPTGAFDMWGAPVINQVVSDIPQYPAKKHHLETIAKYDPSITLRTGISDCGDSGTIAERIADCKSTNGLWSFYDGKKYGQDGEGNWSLVAVKSSGGTKFEVWRDERTKLIWSDRATTGTNWYHAAGYAKPAIDSIRETQLSAVPGVANTSGYPTWVNYAVQPANPLSICPDVVSGEIAAGGGTPGYVYDNGGSTSFKADLAYPQVTWRLPSMNDWKLADVNGIRKVLPRMTSGLYWSSTSYSLHRTNVWSFGAEFGEMSNSEMRVANQQTRCVGGARDP